MKIVEKNAGTKIDFEVSGTKITFADELMLNLAKLQKDEPEHKDICFDDDGDLVIGTAQRAKMERKASRWLQSLLTWMMSHLHFGALMREKE